MAKFFIHRPIFAIVIALIITLVGILAALQLPIAQYPKISPPTVDFFIQQCIRNGFSPHASDYVTDIETGLRLVKLGKGITILNTARSVQVPEGIRVLNIEEVQSESDLDYVAAFKRDNPNPAIPLFVSKIMSLTEWSST